ncbi:hypothetical protein QYE76_037901 [Lolium multiflorum]|uniref:Polyprotein n=1 Tax=Lolium multiflorum TaxID=4521 RepID=A0AAD8T7V0_LOLMU|nr:hypothetical protein QYE76_037901 [Lolium multiflorum]
MGKGATPPTWPPIRGEGAGHPSHHCPLLAASLLHHTLLGLGEALQLFFLHNHHHAVVLLELGGDLPQPPLPAGTGEEGLHRHRIMASPSISFNQFLEKEKLKSNGSNFTDWFRHVRIFLGGGNLQYVLEAPLGPPPPPVVSEDNMNKELPELFSMLKSAEIEIQKEHQVLMVNKTTSFKKQGKPNNKGNFKKGGKKAVAPPEKPKAGPKPDTVCYYCKEKGHWKRNSSKYLADLKSGLIKKKVIFYIHVIDVYLTGSRSSAWVFDTGSVAHICNSKQELRNKRSLARDEVTMRVGNGSKVDVIAVGTLPLYLRISFKPQ